MLRQPTKAVCDRPGVAKRYLRQRRIRNVLKKPKARTQRSELDCLDENHAKRGAHIRPPCSIWRDSAIPALLCAPSQIDERGQTTTPEQYASTVPYVQLEPSGRHAYPPVASAEDHKND